MRSLEEAIGFVNDQLDDQIPQSEDKGRKSHYGRHELIQLFEFVYGKEVVIDYENRMKYGMPLKVKENE